VNGVANAGTRIVVYDARRAEDQAEDRRHALERYDAALVALRAKLNMRKLVSREAIEKAVANLATRNGLAVKYVTVVVEQSDAGFALRWTRDEAALAAECERDGRWPLVTNQAGMSDEQLCAWAIRRYKLHGQIERDMHLVKGPLQVRPIFVQSDDRIRALVAISVWALMALTLMERAGKKALPPQHKNRVPIVARLEALFATIAVITFSHVDSETTMRQVTSLRREAQPIVRAMGLSGAVHAIVQEAARRVAPS
jgi:hypothetical protein